MVSRRALLLRGAATEERRLCVDSTHGVVQDQGHRTRWCRDAPTACSSGVASRPGSDSASSSRIVLTQSWAAAEQPSTRPASPPACSFSAPRKPSSVVTTSADAASRSQTAPPQEPPQPPARDIPHGAERIDFEPHRETRQPRGQAWRHNRLGGSLRCPAPKTAGAIPEECPCRGQPPDRGPAPD